MRNHLFGVIVGCFVLTTLCAAQGGALPAAQSPIVNASGLPGQTWTALGNLSPIEHDNFYTQSYIEQGAALYGNRTGSMTVTPYVSVGLVLDTQGLKWNNKIEPRVGLKLNRLFRNGIISMGSAYSYENRFRSTESSALILYAQDWFGWQSVANKSSRFPGSTWAAIGNISPVEHGDIIAQAYVNQGVVAKRFTKFTLVPFVDTTVSRDTKGFDWDNKVVFGSGAKICVLRRDIYTEFGAGYHRETRFDSGLTAGGLAVFSNFSFGWNLLSLRRGR
jgi:hypothetical protein